MAIVLSWACNAEESWHANRDCQIEWSRKFDIRGEAYIVTLPECEVSRMAVCSYQCRKLYMRMATDVIAERLGVELVRDSQMPHREYGMRSVSMMDAMKQVGPACSGRMSTYYDLAAVLEAMGPARKCATCGNELYSPIDINKAIGWHKPSSGSGKFEYAIVECCGRSGCSERATAEAHKKAKAIFTEKDQWRKAREKYDELRKLLRSSNGRPRDARKSAIEES